MRQSLDYMAWARMTVDINDEEAKTKSVKRLTVELEASRKELSPCNIQNSNFLIEICVLSFRFSPLKN